mmetsp:Transcript_32829/g.53014  ORF Transcript_32829/g.53014 Transcript_32829/m.53014 type:complete len:220 (-) Transcript_32829:881-1540(-)
MGGGGGRRYCSVFEFGCWLFSKGSTRTKKCHFECASHPHCHCRYIVQHKKFIWRGVAPTLTAAAPLCEAIIYYITAATNHIKSAIQCNSTCIFRLSRLIVSVSINMNNWRRVRPLAAVGVHEELGLVLEQGRQRLPAERRLLLQLQHRPQVLGQLARCVQPLLEDEGGLVRAVGGLDHGAQRGAPAGVAHQPAGRVARGAVEGGHHVHPPEVISKFLLS